MDSSQRRGALLFELIVLVVVVVSFAGLSAHYNWLNSIDRFLYDRVVTMLAEDRPSDIVIVGIDEQSLQRFGRWPWRRAEQSRLFRAVADAEPKEVLLDILYSEPTNTTADAELTSALRQLPGLALPMVIEAVTDSGQLVEVLPLPQFFETASAVGHVHPELDDDGISRGVHLFQGIGEPFWPHFVLAAHSRDLDASDKPVADCEVPDFSLQNIRCNYRRVPFVGEPGSFAFVSADALFAPGSAGQARAMLRGKTVLIGSTAIGVSDWVTTPVSGGSRPMSGVEFNANVLTAVRQGTLVADAKFLPTLLLVLLLSVVPPLVLPRLQPGSMLLATAGFVAVPILLFYLMLYLARIYVPLSPAVVAAAMTYPLWSWRRLEVAWRFVTQEIERFSAERLQLGFTALDSARLNTVVSHVATLLGASARTGVLAPGDETSLQTTTSELPGGEYLLRGEVAHGNRRFRIDLRRNTEFPPEETAYVASVLGDTEHQLSNDSAPVERLNAQIGQLNQLAEDVRTTRDVNMKSLEQITSGVCLITTGGLVEYVNTMFTTLTGVEIEANILQIAQRVSAPEGRNWEEIVYQVVVEGNSESIEVQSETHRMLIDCAPLRLDAELKGYWLMTAADVTEIRLVQRQREEALAFLSHDLRSPMVSILALIRSQGDSISDERLTRQIERYAERSLNVSEQFVQLSRVENSEDMDTYDVELGAIANNAIEQVFEQAKEKDIRVVFNDRVGDDGLWLKGNGELLERALVNLLTNAIKYSPAGRRVELAVGLDDQGNCLCEVRDEGYGIPAVDIDNVFEPYYRSKVREIVAQRGAGLGLRFVKTVVERHGGEVSVTSEVNKGSTFSLVFPAALLLDLEHS